jgi:hypothetical protein
MLTGEELGRAQQFLSQLENSATQARQAARNLLFMMNAANMASTFNAVFKPRDRELAAPASGNGDVVL